MSSPITLIIPVYNRYHTLPRLLKSIRLQTLLPQHIIFIDNGSTDQSLTTLREWTHDMLQTSQCGISILQEPRRGACAARNRGLKEARTDWIMWFDSDDYMHPTHIADFTKAIGKNPGAQIIGRPIKAQLPDLKFKTAPFTLHDMMFNHIMRGIFSTQRIIVRRELAQQNLWNESLPRWNDYELGLRLLTQVTSGQVAKVDGSPTVTTYFNPDSLTGALYKTHVGDWEKALQAMQQTLISANRPEAIKHLDVRRIILAATYHREGARKEAQQLYLQVLEHTDHPRQMQLLYHYCRVAGRYTWLLAKMIL